MPHSGRFSRFEQLEERQLLAILAVNGTAGPDIIRIVRTGDTDNVYINDNTSPAITQSLSAINQITVQGFSGADTLLVDLSGGNPIPTGGLNFEAGSGADALRITGSAGIVGSYNPSGVIPNAGSLTVGSARIDFGQVENVSVSTFSQFTLTTCNFRDNLNITSPVDGQNYVTGDSDGVPIAPLTFSGVGTFDIDTGSHDAGIGSDNIHVDASGIVGSSLLALEMGTGYNSIFFSGGSAMFEASDGQYLNVHDTRSTLTLFNSQVLRSVAINGGGTLKVRAGSTQGDDPASFVLDIQELDVGSGGGTIDVGDHGLAHIDQGGWFSIAGNAQLAKTGSGTFIVEGLQVHNHGAALNTIAGTTALLSDAGPRFTPSDPVIGNLTVIATAESTTGQPVVRFGSTQHLASLVIHANSLVSLDANAAGSTTRKVLVTGGLTIDGGTDNWLGTLDLNDNNMIVPTADAAARDTVLAQITNYVKGGFHSFHWNGTGINSSTAAADVLLTNNNSPFALGVSTNFQSSDPTTFSRQPIDTNSVLIRNTYYGDAMLDGQVEFADFFIWKAAMTANYAGGHVGGWGNGQFDYSEPATRFPDYLMWKHFFLQTLNGILPTITDAIVQPPTLHSFATAQSANVGTQFAFTISAGDDNPTASLTFTLDAGAPAGAQIIPIDQQHALFSWTPGLADAGTTHSIVVRVNDYSTTPPLSSFQIVTLSTPTDDILPVMDHINDQSVNPGDSVGFIASASDPNPDAQLTFSLDDGAPEGASITDDGHFTWRPTSDQYADTYELVVRAAVAGTQISVAQAVSIDVVGDDRSPTLTPITNKRVNAGKTLSFHVTATDPNPDAVLTYSVDYPIPYGADITPDGKFSWTPTDDDAGDHTITVRVTDDATPSHSDTEDIHIHVNGHPHIDPFPAPAEWPDDLYVAFVRDDPHSETKDLDFDVTVHDPNLPDDTLAYTIIDSNAPGNPTVTQTSENSSEHTTKVHFHWQIDRPDEPVTYNLALKVSDTDGLIDIRKFHVALGFENPGDPPGPISPVVSAMGFNNVSLNYWYYLYYYQYGQAAIEVQEQTDPSGVTVPVHYHFDNGNGNAKYGIDFWAYDYFTGSLQQSGTLDLGGRTSAITEGIWIVPIGRDGNGHASPAGKYVSLVIDSSAGYTVDPASKPKVIILPQDENGNDILPHVSLTAGDDASEGHHDGSFILHRDDSRGAVTVIIGPSDSTTASGFTIDDSFGGIGYPVFRDGESDITVKVHAPYDYSYNPGEKQIQEQLLDNYYGPYDYYYYYHYIVDEPRLATIHFEEHSPWAPIAHDDQYALGQDSEILTINASEGLLANDNGRDNGPRTVTIVDEPRFGTVALHNDPNTDEPDGSFTYTFDPDQYDFSGHDVFTYVVQDGETTSNIAKVQIDVPPPKIDLQIDSNNDGLIDANDEAIKDSSYLPGKWVAVNDRDSDGDGIPDFADGVDRFGSTKSSPGQFTRLLLDVSGELASDFATVTFDYSENNTDAMRAVDPHDYRPASEGDLVLWADRIGDNQKVFRRVKPAGGSAGGDRIKSGTPIHLSDLDFDANGLVKIWVEGIHPSGGLGADTIKVTLDPGGNGNQKISDRVRVTVVDANLSIDSENKTGLRGRPTGTTSEDQSEEMKDRPGKIIPVNFGDQDHDGLKDYVDGFSFPWHPQGIANASAKFTPLVVTIPAPLDLSDVRISFSYSDSEPALITWSTTLGVNDTPAPGEIRIWTKDGDKARDGADAEAGGDWINPSHAYNAAELGFGTARTKTLYVEGINRRATAGVSSIRIDVDPDGSSISAFHVTDVVNYTVVGYGIQGKIQYDPTAPKPVRGALVSVQSLSGAEIARTWTDRDGNYLFNFSSPPTNLQNAKIAVHTQSRDFGTGYGQVVRAVVVRSPILLTAQSVDFPLPSAPTLERQIVIANFSNIVNGPSAPYSNLAFWTFDAAITASQFHAQVPGVTPGLVEINAPDYVSDSLGLGCFTFASIVHIVPAYYDDWDTILHEYGHAVQQIGGFWPITGLTYDHFSGINLRVQHPGSQQSNILALAFSEGFANFYSMVAQQEAGVSNPPVVGSALGAGIAGDGRFGADSVEAQDAAGTGEDEETSVMRILWDLYDPANEPSDRVQMGFSKLVGMIATQQILTLDGLWKALVADAGNDTQKIIDYGAIFESHNVSPTNLTMTIGVDADGTPTPETNWNPGDPIPRFSWDIPVGSDRNATLGFQAAGQLLNRFGVKIFDGNGNEIYDSKKPGIPFLRREVDFIIDDTVASWSPSAADWATIRAVPGEKHWIIYGGDHTSGSLPFNLSDYDTGPYWSDARTFTTP